MWGQHVAASAYILQGITHGISLAALNSESINVDRGMTMELYPVWLRIAAIIPIGLFTLVYINVQMGYPYLGWPLTSGYVWLQVIEVLWGIYLVKDWKKK